MMHLGSQASAASWAKLLVPAKTFGLAGAVWRQQAHVNCSRYGVARGYAHASESRRRLCDVHAQRILRHWRRQRPDRSLATRRTARGSGDRSEYPAFSGPKERHLETLVHNTLRSIVLTRLIPRTLVQITLQVRSLPEEDASTGVNASLTLLPHLLHTAVLSLLSASIPLRTILTSVLIAIPSSPSRTPLLSPAANELLRAKPIRSVHVFAFSGDRRLLLNESDGRFSYAEWADASEKAEETCCGEAEEGGVKLEGEGMDIDGQQHGESLDIWLREVVRKKVEWEQRWKHAT